jgi:hypothetical protein
MPIVGVLETSMPAGTINTSQTFSAQHNFSTPLNVWSRPYLQRVLINSDEGGVSLWISKFTDSTGVKTGQFTPGIFANKCTSITFNMATNDCIATAVMTTEIFG